MTLRRPPTPKAESGEREGERPIHSRRLLRICGLAAVKALFERDPLRVLRLFFEPRLQPELSRCCAILAAAKKPYREAGAEELARIAGSLHHGGAVAIAGPRPPLSLDRNALSSWRQSGKPILILDGVGNPHNLGAIARSAAFFGLDTMILSDSPHQAMPSDASYRVAEGGLEYLSLYRARLDAILPALRPFYRLVASAPVRPALRSSPPRLPDGRPPALILGNEERGLDEKRLALCDEVLTLPGKGPVQSLNVASAAAVLLYLLTR